MDLISMLVSFLIFVVIIAIVIIGAKWLMTETGLPDSIRKIVMLVLGVIALIVFLLKFVRPWLETT